MRELEVRGTVGSARRAALGPTPAITKVERMGQSVILGIEPGMHDSGGIPKAIHAGRIDCWRSRARISDLSSWRN